MNKRKNKHICKQIPNDYVIVPKEGVYVLMNDTPYSGTMICGMLPIKYCPWCGTELIK